MFHDIPPKILSRMVYLEEIDARDRTDGTTRLKRLRQIPPETGKFIALLASCAPKGNIIEIGTSAGYSTLWLSLVGIYSGVKINTFEVLPEKVKLAKETFKVAGVDDIVNLVQGDALTHLEKDEDISFCFIDAEKEIYGELYDLIVPKIVQGGLLVADNAISHKYDLNLFLKTVLKDKRVDAQIIPIGKGELVCQII